MATILYVGHQSQIFRAGEAAYLTEADLKSRKAQFINPKVFADKTIAADKAISL
jgi:hypothetical protein